MFTRDTDSIYLNRYTIAQLLSPGKGMSRVYSALDTQLNKYVCLKEVDKSDAGRDNINFISLKNEISLLASLSHPGIPRIIDVSEDSSTYSVLMDLIMGNNLEQLLSTTPILSEDFVVSKMLQLTSILSYLHSLPTPIVYLDLKPSNLILEGDNIKLLDFGISQRITPGAKVIHPVGTRGFAAPEQAKVGQPYDLRSDIYSFGVTLYSLLANDLTPQGILNLKDKRPHVSQGLVSIITKCTQPDPDQRFQTISELATALRNYKLLDERVVKKSKRYIHLHRLTATLAVLSLLSSGAAFGADRYMESVSYNSLLSAAQKSQSLEDYSKVIKQRPSDLSLYLEMIEIVKQSDGVFSSDEEAILLPLIRENLTSLQSSPDYPKLSYQMGELYWFFYKSSSNASGQALSVPWFKDSMEGNYQKTQSEALYSLGSFHKDIASAIQTSSDTGRYRAYWNTLRSLDLSKESGEVIQLQYLTTALDFLGTYPQRLLSDGVPKSEIDSFLKQVDTYLSSHHSPSPGRPEELYSHLKGTLPNVKSIIQSTYAPAPKV